jgi:ankyrin repeat protein
MPEPGVPDPAPGPRDAPGSEIDAQMIDLATKIFNLTRAGDTAAVAAYVDAGVPVNLTNDKGDSLLMLAAYHGHPATVAALLERGADPGRPNDRGQTPLAGAVFKKEPEIVRLLLDAGADPGAGQPSAADTAAMFGNEDFLAWFAGRPSAE